MTATAPKLLSTLAGALFAPWCAAQLQDGDVTAGGVPVTVSVADVNVAAEGNSGTSSVQVPVQLSRIPGVEVRVSYAVSDGSARGAAACGPGVDYVSQAPGTVRFAVRETVKSITLVLCADVVDEDPQTIAVKLTAAESATIADGTADVTIQDDDPIPTVGFSAGSAAEGDAGTTSLPFEATLSAASERTLYLALGPALLVAAGDVQGTGGAACGGAVDYITPQGPVTINPGMVRQTIDVKVCGDATLEPNEKVGVTAGGVSAPGSTGNTLTAGIIAYGTILNDDAPRLTIESATVPEGGGSGVAIVTGPVTVTVRLSQPTTKSVTASVRTRDGAATGGAECPRTAPTLRSPDYVTLASSVTIPPGALTASIPLSICRDALREPDEEFVVVLSNPVNATIGMDSAKVTIRNDD